MNKQQIESILNNAPEGATHYSLATLDYFLMGVILGWQSWCDVNNSWHQDVTHYDLRKLSDLQTQLDQLNEIERLKSVLLRVEKDLLMRAETDSEGLKVVDLSSSLWNEIKELNK